MWWECAQRACCVYSINLYRHQCPSCTGVAISHALVHQIPLTFLLENYYADCIFFVIVVIDFTGGTKSLYFMAGYRYLWCKREDKHNSLEVRFYLDKGCIGEQWHPTGSQLQLSMTLAYLLICMWPSMNMTWVLYIQYSWHVHWRPHTNPADWLVICGPLLRDNVANGKLWKSDRAVSQL